MARPAGLPQNLFVRDARDEGQRWIGIVAVRVRHGSGPGFMAARRKRLKRIKEYTRKLCRNIAAFRA